MFTTFLDEMSASAQPTHQVETFHLKNVPNILKPTVYMRALLKADKLDSELCKNRSRLQVAREGDKYGLVLSCECKENLEDILEEVNDFLFTCKVELAKTENCPKPVKK